MAKEAMMDARARGREPRHPRSGDGRWAAGRGGRAAGGARRRERARLGRGRGSHRPGVLRGRSRRWRALSTTGRRPTSPRRSTALRCGASPSRRRSRPHIVVWVSDDPLISVRGTTSISPGTARASRGAHVYATAATDRPAAARPAPDRGSSASRMGSRVERPPERSAAMRVVMTGATCLVALTAVAARPRCPRRPPHRRRTLSSAAFASRPLPPGPACGGTG